MKFHSFIAKLLLLCSLFIVTGCGDSNSEDTLDANGNPTSGRVAHQSWPSYNLYRFSAEGAWVPVISQGTAIADIGAIGDRPTIILHGLGSDIASGRFNTLATSLRQSGSTAIFGFEYDSLDPITKNGNLFLTAFADLTEGAPGATWSIAGHSMGALVARVALESDIPLDIAAEGNRATFIAGPHLGSEVAEELQDRNDVIGEALGDIILDGRLEFRNADGRPVSVTGQEQGFSDLRRDSEFLAVQNFEAANHHPQFDYRTVAGNNRGSDYEAFNRVLGTYADDGLVNIESANAAVIGPVDTEIVPYDHTSIVDAADSVRVILVFMGF